MCRQPNSAITTLNNDNNKPIEKIQDDDENFNWFNIISFAIAGMPYYLMLTVIGVYANKFLLDEVKILPKNTSIILFASGAIDAITDPIYGHFINISPMTRIGKMKPWILVSVPLSMVFYLLLWYKPGFSSQLDLIIWFTFLLSSFYTIVTVSREWSLMF